MCGDVLLKTSKRRMHQGERTERRYETVFGGRNNMSMCKRYRLTQGKTLAPKNGRSSLPNMDAHDADAPTPVLHKPTLT